MSTVRDLQELLSKLDPAETIIFDYYTRDMFDTYDNETLENVEVSAELFDAAAAELNGYSELPGSYELRGAINDELHALHNTGQGA